MDEHVYVISDIRLDYASFIIQASSRGAPLTLEKGLIEYRVHDLHGAVVFVGHYDNDHMIYAALGDRIDLTLKCDVIGKVSVAS